MKQSNTVERPRPSRNAIWARSGLLAMALGAALSALVATPRASANILTDIGRFFGRPLGGFVEAATVPSIRATEASGHRLIADVNARVSARIEQTTRAGDQLIYKASKATEQRITQVDRAASDRLAQADAIMAARIAQVDASADARIAQTLGGLQSLEQQTMRDARATLTQLDDAAKARIAQVDVSAAARISQVHGVVQDAIDDADSAVEARITQIDEVAERRLGSVDVIATKTSLNLQITLLKVGALLGMVVFLVFAFKYLFEHVPKKLAELNAQRPAWGPARRGALVTATASGWILLHLAAGGIGVAVFGVLANKLPIGAQKQADAMTAAHQAGLERSYQALDFTRVRYHAAQLTILDPAGEPQYRALEARANLIRTTFARPGLLTSGHGLQELAQRIAEAQAAQQQVSGGPAQHPDILTIQCYVRWQLATSRRDELQAVTACARALETATVEPTFLLRPIARQYLRLYLERTPPKLDDNGTGQYSLAALEQLAQPKEEREPSGLLGAAQVYDALVLDLDRKVSKAYLGMLEAHADLVRAAATLPPKPRKPSRGKEAAPSASERVVDDAKRVRSARAQELIAAFREFDRQLQATIEPIDGSLPLSALTLNDAPLSQALWFEASPDALSLPPRVEEEAQLAVRVAMAPIRIAWARRYLAQLSPDIQQLAGHQETERFARDERATLAFAKAYVGYRTALAGSSADLPALRDTAAQAAATMNLYASGGSDKPQAFGLTLLQAPGTAPSAEVVSAVHAGYAETRLRLL